MPTVMISSLAEDGSTSVGSYSLCFPYYIAGKVFALTFLCYLSMGYLASREGSSAAMNWIEQGVNTLGQALLLFGVVSLHKAGLRELSSELALGAK